MSALRVEANWKNPFTQIRKLTSINHRDLVSGVQLLGDHWLVTLSRRQTALTTYLSAWYLDGGSGAHCAAKIEVVDGSSKFAAAVRQDGNSALIALFNNSKTTGFVIPAGWGLHIGVLTYHFRRSRGIEVFSLDLNTDYLCRNTLTSPLNRIARILFSRSGSRGHGPLQHHGMFIEIQVNNNIVAASLAKSNESGPPLTYQIVLVDIETHTVAVLEQGFPEVRFKCVASKRVY